ncbi:MAG: helix-turn-helix domain-containing protein, partial [Novosphingobium sp.]
VDVVSRSLDIHPRTLHRRLRGEATSFRALVDAVRRQALLYFVHETDLDITAISDRLGFSEQSALAHFCRRQFGMAPRELRKSL